MKRRAFLRVLGFSPIAARVAAKEAAANLGGIVVNNGSTVGIAVNQLHGVGNVGSPATTAGPSINLTRAQVRAAKLIPGVRDQLRSVLFEEHRRVYAIDPDIAVHRSFSLNAMIAYQRQRNVQRAYDEIGSETYIGNRIYRIALKALGFWNASEDD